MGERVVKMIHKRCPRYRFTERRSVNKREGQQVEKNVRSRRNKETEKSKFMTNLMFLSFTRLRKMEKIVEKMINERCPR